jgi:hypothetical protein
MGNQMMGCCYDREALKDLETAPDRMNRKQYKMAKKHHGHDDDSDDSEMDEENGF